MARLVRNWWVIRSGIEIHQASGEVSQVLRNLRFVLLAVAVSGLAAQEPSRPEGRRAEAAKAESPKAEAAKPQRTQPAPPAEEKISRTSHSLRIGGQDIKYTATAGTLVMKKEDGSPVATVFFTAYTKDEVGDLSRRPITFAYNGGPGSSSVWLHMGALGPKRVLMEPDGTPLPPPYKLVDNEYSLVDVTDLVFIDPVSTGYSRPAPGQEPGQFHGLREDTESVGEFIRLYATRFQRWASPKFLAGESYGTTRSAALSGYLQQSVGMYLNGIVLISSILNFQTSSFAPGNDLAYILYLPTYTASAWYHKKLPKELQGDLKKALAEAERFAAGEYTLALMKGDAISAEERAAIAKKVARLTGLSPEYVEHANLRIHTLRFDKELLRSERRTVGRYDSRMKGIDADAAGERPEYDPSYPIVQGPYTAMFNQYVRGELKFESELPYEILTDRVRPWSYAGYENRYVNVAETLRSAMTQNPQLRVFAANGYYDLATPYFATQYTFQHMGLDPTLRDHVTMGFYEAGHMMYIHQASIEKLKQDIAKFMQAAVK